MTNRTVSDFNRTENRISTLSIEDAARMDFQPWATPRAGDWLPPTKEEWMAMADTHAVHLRTAWKMMECDKAALMAMTKTLGGDASLDLLDCLDSTARFLEGTAMIVKEAAGRMTIATSATLAENVGAGAARDDSIATNTPPQTGSW